MNNGAANGLKVMGVILIVLGVIGALALGGSVSGDFAIVVVPAGILVSVISGLVVYGFGELIGIADDSKQYLSHIANNMNDAIKTKETATAKSDKNNKKEEEEELPFI